MNEEFDDDDNNNNNNQGQSVLDGLVTASRRVMATAADYDQAAELGFLGNKRRIPSELGLTDVFMCAIALACGRANNKTLQRMEFAENESESGYDFEMEFLINGQDYRFYFQAKCIKQHNTGYYADFLARTKGESKSLQWHLLRKYVANELIQNHLNTRGTIIRGFYILFGSNDVLFIPIGHLHALSTMQDDNMALAFSTTGVWSLVTIYSAIANKQYWDLSNPAVLFENDDPMDAYAAALWEQQKPDYT